MSKSRMSPTTVRHFSREKRFVEDKNGKLITIWRGEYNFIRKERMNRNKKINGVPGYSTKDLKGKVTHVFDKPGNPEYYVNKKNRG